MLKKNALTMAVGLCMGSSAAQAGKFEMTFMDFPGAQNSTVAGAMDTTAQTGTMTSGATPFFGHAWTGTLVFGADNNSTSTITGSWNYSAVSGASATGTYNYSLAPGQSVMGILFDWNTSSGIPVLNIVNSDGTGVDIDGDGTLGTVMAEGPFKDSPVGFAGYQAVTAGNIALNAPSGVSTPWTPAIAPLNKPNGSSISYGCAIVPPVAGAAVASDCSSGTFTGTSNTSFTYQVTNTELTDPADPASPIRGTTATGTVSVTISTTGVAPVAQNDTASTSDGAAVSIDVLTNDSDADGDLDPTSVAFGAMAPTNGTLSGPNPTTGAITYQPNAGFCGTDTFSYTVRDLAGNTSNAALVTVDVGSSAPCSPGGGATVSGGSSDPDNDGLVSLSDLISAGIPQDGGVDQQCIGGCFDFVLTGFSGTTANVILPLSAPIPNRSRLRKWNGSAWVDFVEDANNRIETAASVGGICPGGGYTPNLKQGDQCIRLILEDGGPNDQDGQVNGSIVDPTGIGRDALQPADTELGSASGCTIASTGVGVSRRFDWAILLGFVTWLGLRRKSRT